MRDYCRVFHTSIDYLAGMPVGRLIEEIEDATEEITEERRQLEKSMKDRKAKAGAQGRLRGHRRR